MAKTLYIAYFIQVTKAEQAKDKKEHRRKVYYAHTDKIGIDHWTEDREEAYRFISKDRAQWYADSLGGSVEKA